MKVAVALLLALLAGGCSSTQAMLFGVGDCRLERLGSAALEVRGGLDLVQVQVNGVPLRLVVDTGADHTLLANAAAARLGLRTDLRHGTRSWGVAGPTARFDARVDSFILAGLALPVHSVAAGDLNVAAVPGGADGVLGTDVLRWFAVDLDPAAGRLTLYRGEPCQLAAPPWPEPAVALAGVEGVRSRLAEPRALLVPIDLNGARAMALLDTGSQASAVTLELAQQAGVDAASLAADRTIAVGGAGPGHVIVPLHRFRSLRIGAWTAEDPVLPVLDVPRADNGERSEDDPDPTVRRPWRGVVGQDLLRGRRMWISLAGWQVFLSEPKAAVAK